MTHMDVDHLHALVREKITDFMVANQLEQFFESYSKIPTLPKFPNLPHLFEQYIDLVNKQLHTSYSFDHYHESERQPFDYYDFGRDMVRPLLDLTHSSILGQENLQSIISSINRGDNVILMANHQSEIDPQIISLLIDGISPELASSIIYIAGHRVTSDPLAVPFSRGINLLCIYSKRYIDHPPEEKEKKLYHNTKTLTALEHLLTEGGKCIYVAPSGGRDRYDANREIEIAPFDPQSVEIFHLLDKKSKIPTHFHLFALSTISLLPPPSEININLGEARHVSFSPAHLFFGPEIDMEKITTSTDKKTQRLDRSTWMTEKIKELYSNFKRDVGSKLGFN